VPLTLAKAVSFPGPSGTESFWTWKDTFYFADPYSQGGNYVLTHWAEPILPTASIP